jgi:hypothetical protein
MKPWRMWPASAVVTAMLLLAVYLMLPGVAFAGAGANTQAPVDGQTGICVTGQVINKAHVGIANLQVSAASPNQPNMTTITAQNGTFSFSGLTPGLWTFQVTVPDAWQAVTPAEFNVELAYGHGSCYPVRFKLNPVGCIVAHKQDTQGNPLPNWAITATGLVDPTGTTDAQGNVVFSNLSPGRYVVSEEVQYGWKAVTPARQTVDVHASVSAADCTQVTFQNEALPTTCITGYKVNDQHQGLAGWNIYAEPASGSGPTFMAQTDSTGAFTFPNLTLGTWRLWEDVQAGWKAVTPSSFDVTLNTAGTVCTVVRFKNRAPDLCASGYKLDEYYRGLVGWTITAAPKSDPTRVMTATTDARGYYRFIGLTQETWVFTETHQTGWMPISASQFEVAIKPNGGSACTQVPTFRNRSPRACIEGYKRDDLQVGLPGWNISLQPVNGGTYQHRWTDGTGHFQFNNLPLGDYWVWEEMQPGWQPVSPPKVRITVDATDTNECAQAEFVNMQVPRDICIDGYKLDTAGGVGLPGFTVTATLATTNTVLTQETDGLGYFRFSNLAPGTYTLKVGELPGWVPAGPTTLTAKVDWPPKLTCTRVKFWDRQSR